MDNSISADYPAQEGRNLTVKPFTKSTGARVQGDQVHGEGCLIAFAVFQKVFRGGERLCRKGLVY